MLTPTPRTPFARLEQRTHRAVLGHLANATVQVYGVDVPVIYDRPHYGAGMGLAEASQPEMLAQTTDVAPLRQGDRIYVNSNGDVDIFRVASTEPDGTGLTRVVLEQA